MSIPCSSVPLPSVPLAVPIVPGIDFFRWDSRPDTLTSPYNLSGTQTFSYRINQPELFNNGNLLLNDQSVRINIRPDRTSFTYVPAPRTYRAGDQLKWTLRFIQMDGTTHTTDITEIITGTLNFTPRMLNYSSTDISESMTSSTILSATNLPGNRARVQGSVTITPPNPVNVRGFRFNTGESFQLNQNVLSILCELGTGNDNVTSTITNFSNPITLNIDQIVSHNGQIPVGATCTIMVDRTVDPTLTSFAYGPNSFTYSGNITVTPLASRITFFDWTSKPDSNIPPITISGAFQATYNVTTPESVRGNLTLLRNGEVMFDDISPTETSINRVMPTSRTYQEGEFIQFTLQGIDTTGEIFSFDADRIVVTSSAVRDFAALNGQRVELPTSGLNNINLDFTTIRAQAPIRNFDQTLPTQSRIVGTRRDFSNSTMRELIVRCIGETVGYVPGRTPLIVNGGHANVDLTNCNFSGCNFSNARIETISGSGYALDSTVLEGRPDANGRGGNAILDFTGSNFTNVDWSNSIITLYQAVVEAGTAEIRLTQAQINQGYYRRGQNPPTFNGLNLNPPPMRDENGNPI